jgi:hypothetical protein
MSAPVPANCNVAPVVYRFTREWRAARRPRLVVDTAPAPDPGAAAFHAARAAVAARRRDLAAGIEARGDATP